eukprot:794236-Pyramimonas_sp.AAC.2
MLKGVWCAVPWAKGFGVDAGSLCAGVLLLRGDSTWPGTSVYGTYQPSGASTGFRLPPLDIWQLVVDDWRELERTVSVALFIKLWIETETNSFISKPPRAFVLRVVQPPLNDIYLTHRPIAGPQ